MIRLVFALTRADLRAAPERAVTVAALLTAAALLPPLLGVEPLLGVMLAVGVAAAAAAGVTAQHRRRQEVLVLNGAPPALDVGIAAASVVAPGLAATLAASLVGARWDGSPGVAAALALAFLVPVIVAPLAALLWLPLHRSHRRGVALVLLVVLLAPTVVVPLGALAVFVSRRLARAGTIGRVAGAVVATVAVLCTAVVAGGAESWFGLWLVLLLSGVPLALAVAWLGSGALDLVGPIARRLGPMARLAVVPLAERRRVLAPVVGAVALVTTLAALEGVVGASFGQREADRDRDGLLLGRAGGREGQAIVVTSGNPDPLRVRRVAASAADDAGVRVAVIDRMGPGGTEVDVDRPGGSWFLPSFEVAPTWRLVGTRPPSTSWVGVIDPDELDALGLEEGSDALARGNVLVLADSGFSHGKARLRGPDGVHELPAANAGQPGHRSLRLPAALISPERAAELSTDIRSARVVLERGLSGRTDADVSSMASRIRDSLLPDTDPTPTGLTGGDDGATLVAVESSFPVVMGDDPVRTDPGGPLNEVPFLSRTREAGRGQVLALAGLAGLVALAGTVLVLGGSRADDAVLDAQGASRGARAAMTAVQASALTATASVLAAAIGIGLPALAFSRYNARPRGGPATDIPLVVPGDLIVALVALPVMAAVLAALVTALRPAPSPSRFDDLAW